VHVFCICTLHRKVQEQWNQKTNYLWVSVKLLFLHIKYYFILYYSQYWNCIFMTTQHMQGQINIQSLIIILREETDGHWAINWLSEISQEKWILEWDGGWQWGQLSINLVIKRTRNLPISALVKSTYRRCNALFDKRGKEVTTMLTSSQVYKQVLNKVIEDTQRKANAHIVLKFHWCDTRFLVKIINPREVWAAGNFSVRLDER